MKTFRFIPLVLLFCLALPACEQEQPTTEKKYLDGYITIGPYTKFINPGTSLTFYPKGVTHPEKKALGLYTYLNGVKNSVDTVYSAYREPHYLSGSKVVRNFPDSLAAYLLYFYIYPIDGSVYYSTYSYLDVVTVDYYKSLPTTAVNPAKPLMDSPDPRDGENYNVFTTSTGKKWTSQNYAFRYSKINPADSLGHDYCDSPAVRKMFGGFYTWTEAQKVCPSGWHLPTDAEWVDLAKYLNPSIDYKEHQNFPEVAGKMMVDATFNKEKMWNHWPDVKIVDSLHVTLGALPMGYMQKKTAGAQMDFVGAGSYAFFWTADSYDKDSSQAYYRYIYEKENDLKTGHGDKQSLAMSVRCVKD